MTYVAKDRVKDFGKDRYIVPLKEIDPSGQFPISIETDMGNKQDFRIIYTLHTYDGHHVVEYCQFPGGQLHLIVVKQAGEVYKPPTKFHELVML